MNINLLIDAIVRQTVILIAQLATTAGGRAPLAHVANEVFLSLAAELKEQGVGQKIIADMFGMALRTYHSKVQRLSESATERGRSLWEAVLTYIAEREVVRRGEVMAHFHRDDAMTVKGVLNDLVETGLLYKTGRGDRTAYRAASEEDLSRVLAEDLATANAAMVQVAVHRLQPTTRADVLKQVPMSEDDLEEALALLTSDARIRSIDLDGEEAFTCEQCVISYGDSVGWEAAVFDHYHSMVSGIIIKLNLGRTTALPQDAVGGSTYGFDIYEGHPLEAEALGMLRETRERASELRGRVDAHNAGVELETKKQQKVVFYVGQSVRQENSSGRGD